MVKIAVDTNAVIAFRAGNQEVCGYIRSAEIIVVPATVMGELLYGALNSKRIEENKNAVTRFMKYSVFVPIDERISFQYAKIRTYLKKNGRPIPENDIWIAATCIEMDIPLLSRDTHFGYVDDLNVISW